MNLPPADLARGEWQPCGLAIVARFWATWVVGSLPGAALIAWWLA